MSSAFSARAAAADKRQTPITTTTRVRMPSFYHTPIDRRAARLYLFASTPGRQPDMTHTVQRLWLSICLLAVIFVALSRRADAQNWSFDARLIALGNVAGSGNLAYDMIPRQQPYTVIPLPFGLVQILKDFDIYNPDSPKFDPVRAVEYVSSPIHYIIGRDDDTQAQRLFVSDLRNATLSRDLSRYQGFVPASDLFAEGLAKPLWGGTIKFQR